MSWSYALRRVVYSASLALIAGLAFWAASQTLLATDHIELSQTSPNAVTATANQPVRNWNHVFGSSSMTDCATARYSSSNDQVSAARTRTITWTTGSRRDGNFLCVRTLVDTAQQEYAYSSPLRIDLAGPTVRFESGRSASDSIQATVNDFESLHTQAGAATEVLATDVVSGASFRYAILRSSSDCSVRNLNLRTIDTGLVRTSTTASNLNELKVNIPVTADNHNQYVCLKSTDQFGNVSYQSSARLDTEISRVSLTKTNDQIRLTAGEILTSVWAEATAGQTCDYASLRGNAASAQGVTSHTIAIDGNQIVCFSVTDRQSNSAGYSYTLDTAPPTLPVISQSGRIVIATSSDEDQRDTSHQTDNDYPKDWGIKSWSSYFIDTDATTNLVATLEAACSADNYGQHGSADTDNNIDAWRAYSSRSSQNRLTLSSSHSRYEAICFRATDHSGSHNYEQAELDSFESGDPVINSQRTNYQNEVTLTLSSTSKRATTWRWNVMGQDDETCDSTQIGSANPSTSNKIPVEDSDIGQLFCVEVLLNDNSRIYQLVEAGTSPIDHLSPVISAAWERNSLRASATDDLSGVKSTTWQWQIVTNPDNIVGSCQADETADPKITSWRRGSNTGSLGTTRNGQFICFRVSDNVGNVGYNHFEIEVVSQSTDTTRPVVNVRRNGQTVTASSSASDLPSVPDWRYVIRGDSDCDEDVFNNAGSSLGYGNSVQLIDGDDVWVCFQVTDSAGNDGHGKLRVDLAGPTITVSQSGSTVTATADETASGWIYFRSDDRPDYCVADSEFNFNKRQTFVGRTVRDLTAADVGKYLCFRANDSHNNQDVAVYQISGPIGQPVQPQSLTISFAQSPTQLVASANRAVTTWRYLVYESAPTNCDGNNTYFSSDFAGHSNIVDLETTDSGRYYCFEATASDSTQAYASHRVNISTSPSTDQPTTTQPVNVLTVSIDQNHGTNQLTATANRTVSTWRYLIYATEPANCDNTNSYFAANNGRIGRDNVVDLIAEDSGRYYCFEAADAEDRKAYGLHQVETVTTPTKPEEVKPDDETPAPVVNVSIDRQNNQLVASADLSIAQWRYLIYATEPTCDDSNTYFDGADVNSVGQSHTANLAEQSVGRYYCFRAKTSAGQTGYAVHQVTRPVADPIVDETPEPQDVKPPAEVKVVIGAQGDYLVAKANQPIAQWRYLIYTTKPDCSDANVYFKKTGSKIGTSNKALRVTNTSDRYYCFQAKTSDNRTGYALVKIPATSPEPTAPPQETTTTPEPEQEEESQPTSTTTVVIQTTTPPAAEQPTSDETETEEVPEEDKPLPVDETPTTTTTEDEKDPATTGGDDDDDLPWLWIGGGVAAAILIVLLVFWPRRSYDDDDDEADEPNHNLNI